MRIHRRAVLVAGYLACAAAAHGGPARRHPHIGYLYPGGGQRGTTFEVVVGGQMLRGAAEVYVSGEGVSASVVEYYKPFRNLMQEQRETLRRQLTRLKRERVAALPPEERKRIPRFPGELPNARAGGRATKSKPAPVDVELPGHPILRDLEKKDLRGLLHVADSFLNWKMRQRKQLNTQLSESVLVRVTVGADAEPGDRELRLATPLGLTNPMCFQVGTAPEVCEAEPNDPKTRLFLPVPEAVGVPVLLNGQTMPGDVDRFRIAARRGQRLVVRVHARRLVPFLADAVPGWFQATVALYDDRDREVAYADDFRFDPDPVIYYEVPEDGEYQVEIRDSIYRGREDFVYRIVVGEFPFVTHAFPLGARAGSEATAEVRGWNLPATRLPLDTSPDAGRIRAASLRTESDASNEIVYAVDTLPESVEAEPNDDAVSAPRIEMPHVVNGRIARPGDIDVFRIEGHAGEELVAEVAARRLHSPLDSVVRLFDATGTVLAWNDDNVVKTGHLHRDMGVMTHHADSYLRHTLPEDGAYWIQVADVRGHGSDAHAYRLRVSLPRPDVDLYVTPSSLFLPAGRSVAVTVHALPKDGFEGDVQIALDGAPAGFVLDGAVVPAGRDRVRMTLTAPRTVPVGPLKLGMVGRFRSGEETVRRRVVPSDNVMQAFLWRHLAPSRDFVAVAAKARRGLPPVTRSRRAPVRLPAGGEATVRFTTRARPGRNIEFRSSDAPKGVSIREVKVVPGGVTLEVALEADALDVGYADNLIVEMFASYTPRAKDTEKGPAKRRTVSLGVLPAIPFVVVAPADPVVQDPPGTFF